MTRISREHLELCTALVAKQCGRHMAESYDDVGGWTLDSMNPGDGRTYAIEGITTAGGGTTRPLGNRRFTARELEAALYMASTAIELAERARA